MTVKSILYFTIMFTIVHVFTILVQILDKQEGLHMYLIKTEGEIHSLPSAQQCLQELMQFPNADSHM